VPLAVIDTGGVHFLRDVLGSKMGILADACEAKISCQTEELFRVISRPTLINYVTLNSLEFISTKQMAAK